MLRSPGRLYSGDRDTQHLRATPCTSGATNPTMHFGRLRRRRGSRLLLVIWTVTI